MPPLPRCSPSPSSSIVSVVPKIRRSFERKRCGVPFDGYPVTLLQTLAKKDADAALRCARDTWMGSAHDGHAEATAATRVALRGRDPFYDDDKTAQLRFAQLAAALFTALEDASPLDPAVLA